MNRMIISLILILLSILTIKPCFGFDGEKELISELMKGKQALENKTGGLGYTQNEVMTLDAAYKKLFKKENVPVCEVMKISIDLKYHPYDVLRLIYSNGKDVPLDQLCMCSTEAGINKSIIVRAAVDAKTSSNEPTYSRDEITQAQCLSGETGLSYVEQGDPPPPINPPSPPKPYSSSTPSK